MRNGSKPDLSSLQSLHLLIHFLSLVISRLLELSLSIPTLLHLCLLSVSELLQPLTVVLLDLGARRVKLMTKPDAPHMHIHTYIYITSTQVVTLVLAPMCLMCFFISINSMHIYIDREREREE